MKYFILGFAILSVLSQLPHAYWTINYTSNIRGVIKGRYGTISVSVVQNIVFCMIIATSILILVFMKLHAWALIGAIVETLINIYYVHCSYEELYQLPPDRRMTREMNEILREKKRKLVGSYFIAILIPTCIYVFSYLYTVV